MRRIEYSGQFKRDARLCQKRGKDMDKLKALLGVIIDGGAVPERYLDHPLKGEWKGYRDAHIEPDWLLIYHLSKDAVRFERTGRHADLFED